MSQQCYAKTIDFRLLKLYDWAYGTGYFRYCRDCPGRESCISCRVAEDADWAAMENTYNSRREAADRILEEIYES